MRTISLVMLFALAFTVTCMPSDNQESRDIVDTLLPLFGKKKLHTIVTQRTIDFIQRFFDLNPKFYDNFKTALSPVGVYLPELENVKWDTAKQEDFDKVKAVLGEITFADVITDKKLVQSLVDQLEKDKEFIANVLSRINEAGVTYEDDADIDVIGRVLSKQITTGLLASFSPIAMQIFWFGKREIVDNKIDWNNLLNQVISVLPAVLASITGNARINIQQIIQHVKPLVQQFLASHYQQIKPFISQIISQAQTFLTANPQIYQFLNQQLSSFGIQLPRIDFDWNTALNILVSSLPTLINLFGKREIVANKIDWNNLLNQVISVLPAVLASITGNKNRLTIQQIIQHAKPLVQQFLASHYQQIFQHIKPIVQQFLASNPQIAQFINQHLSNLIQA